MFKDPYHPNGWIELFKALNSPCECERGVTHDQNGKALSCRRSPLPYPGYRWYHTEIADSQDMLQRLSTRIMSRVRPPARGRRVRVAA